MKKQDIAGIIVYVLILAFAAVFGLVVVNQYSSKSNMETWQFILFVAGAIVAGLLFNSILYEIAHMIGAKIGGYKITLVSILGFTFLKENNKTKFRFMSFDGLTGETKIIPIEKRKKPSNPVPYLLMGTIVYAIEVVGVIFAFSILTREGGTTMMSNIAYFLLIVMAVGGIIVFYNIIPFRLDSMNDGYRLRLVSGKKNKEAFNKALLGITEDSPNEDGQIEENTSFSSDLKLNQVLTCLNEEKYVEAEQLVDSIIANADIDKKISNKTLLEANAQKIFLVFMNNDEETAQKFFDENLTMQDRKRLSDELSLPCIRAYVLISSLLDRSHSECTRALDRVYKAYKRTPENRRQLESKLFNIAIEMVNKKHPNWNLSDYEIKE